MTLKEEIDRADAALRETWDTLVGSIAITDIRSQLLLSYASIALEHLEAILLLASRGLTGSAFALIRPVFEIFYRATWIYVCAKEHQVEKIKAGKFKFPEMKDMVAAIDDARGYDFFTQCKELSWADQNDFTHTGKLQIKSRLTREDLQAAYPEEMIAIQISTVTIPAILVTVLLLKTHSRTSDGERLERLIMQFDLSKR